MPARTAGAAAFATIDWTCVASELDQEGYAVLPGLLDAHTCAALAQRLREARPRADAPSLLQGDPASVNTGGHGTCWPIQRRMAPFDAWHEALYPRLAPIANHWATTRGLGVHFPALFEDFNAHHGTAMAATWLGAGHYQPLHQSHAGPYAFPLQLVLLLSEPEVDFEGGDCVMTEQRPRMQSRAMVLPLRQGDAALMAVAHRPVWGSKGHYRVSSKHAVTPLRRGERVALEFLFHSQRRGNEPESQLVFDRA
ncbi:MAG: prolyl 4-hydroxylase [Rhodoferax sp.]|nr:prolyl 4-hydroxylase [Rhodoferax sp.]